MATRSFVEWDFDNKIVTQYEREGRCNQCGECCKVKITFIGIPSLESSEGSSEPQEWWSGTDRSGTWNEIQWYGARKFIQLRKLALSEDRCKDLTRSNKCLMRLFGEWSSVFCMAWPLSPKCIEPFPNCGYSFVETGHWTIKEY